MTWEAIEEITLESAAASVTFNTGLGGYKFFRLTAFGIRALTGVNTVISIRLNGDTGTNYTFQQIAANGTNVTGARSTSQTSVGLTDSNGWDDSQALTAMFTALIAKPAASTKAHAIGQSNYPAGTPANTTGELNLIGGEWNNTTDLISSITILVHAGNFAAGSSFLLEGLAF